MAQLVHDFETGSMGQKDLLGGKGANLAEMTRLGIPVPPGFTITTDACRAYLASGTAPPELFAEVDDHLERLEARMGRTLGDGEDPLLVSVRSGAKFSMPGMMETVLDIGLGDASVEGLARQTGDPRFAWDSYRRLVQMYGRTVLDLDGDRFEDAIDAAKAAKGVTADVDLDADDLRALVATFKQVVDEDDRVTLPAGPARAAAWRGAGRLRLVELRPRDPLPPPRAHPHRPRHRRQRAGHGLRQPRRVVRARASPSPATRRPARWASTATTCRTPRARTSWPASATPRPWPTWSRSTRTSYDELLDIMARLESHYRDMCDIEFTIEQGHLWMLQTRVGKRTAAGRVPHRCRPGRRGRHHRGGGPDAGHR